MKQTNDKGNLSKMVVTSKVIDTIPLWDHQRAAYDKILVYVNDFRAGKTRKSALVHMPTGTGKSGVIAVLGRVLPNIGSVLVLTPRKALRDQLADDIRNRFFDHLKPPYDPSGLPKTVVCLKENPKPEHEIDPETKVYVSTIQLFYSWAKSKTAFYEKLKDKAQLLIVDEGHYEPAPNWQDAIRDVNCPKVLLTATPYRNDLKIFDVALNYSYSLSHKKAERDNYLRKLQPVPRTVYFNDPVAFVKDVLTFYDATFPNAARTADAQRPRVIIRCDAHDRIRLIANEVKRQGRTVIAIHERFEDKGINPDERKHVPDKSELIQADFWIHQFKLLEGIDDERFQIVAAFDALKTTRALVQQVGRALRNTKRKPNQKAYLLDHDHGRLVQMWNGYRKYDEYLDKHGIEAALESGQDLARNLLSSQQRTVYLNGTFRTPLDLNTFDPIRDILLPRRVNIYTTQNPVDLKQIKTEVSEVCKENDLVQRSWLWNADTLVVLYIVQENSPLLQDTFFMNIKLACCIVKVTPQYMYILDTAGELQSRIVEDKVPVECRIMQKLAPESQNARIVRVSVHNSNLANDAIRTRTMAARAIYDTAPYPDDRNSVCTTVEGLFESDKDQGNAQLTRRYIGFEKGRVSETLSETLTFSEYVKWIGTLESLLDSSNKTRSEFRRYAAEASKPKDPTPTHILLDLSEAFHLFVCTGHPIANDNTALASDDLCAKVKSTGNGDGQFDVSINSQTFHFNVTQKCKDGRWYELVCPEVESCYKPNTFGQTEGLIRYLNKTQSFRILTKTQGYFYSLGQFFAPGIRFGPAYDDNELGILKVLIPVPELAFIGDEKGNEKVSFTTGSWPNGSLFELVDTQGKGTSMSGLFGSPDIVICDDMATEAADFIMADLTRNRVLFVHAKASTEQRYCSATHLTEVLGQATKNMKFLSKFNDQEMPSKTPKWHNTPWKLGVNTLPRVRKGTGTGRDVWNQVRTVIRDPLSDVEVWIVVGQLLSKRQFQKKLCNPTPNQEAVQLAYLLLSVITSATSVGAKVRVYCSP